VNIALVLQSASGYGWKAALGVRRFARTRPAWELRVWEPALDSPRRLAAWRPDLRISPAARELLLRHDWPGNVRELRNVLEAAAALCDGDALQPEHLDLPPAPAPRRGTANYHLEVDALRRRLLEDALAASGGRRAEAARRLGLSRQALSYLMGQLGLGARTDGG